jgi:outer membrane murein-binding lipoprotein Lpp
MVCSIPATCSARRFLLNASGKVILMITRKKLRLLCAVSLASLFLLIPGCKYFTRSEDPQLKEANKLETEADALSAKVDDAYKQVAQKDEEINAAKKDKARIKKLSDEEVALYDGAAKDARDAADKYEQASKLKVDAKYQEYLNLRGQYMRKHGAHLAALKDLIAARLEVASKPTKASRDKQTEAKARSERLKKEVDELKAQADKIQKENGDKFKPAKS